MKPHPDNIVKFEIAPYLTALTIPEILERGGISVNGSRFIALRPENEPSARVYPNHIFDYGAGAYLDAIAVTHYILTGRIESHPTGEEFWCAVRWIAHKGALPEPKRDPQAEAHYHEARDRSAYFEQVFEDACVYRTNAVEYLKGRRISAVAVGDDIGYFPPEYEPGDQETAERYGLLSKSRRFLFAGYVVFPFRAAGRIETFYGRYAGDTKPGYKHRKPAGPQPVCFWNQDNINPREPVHLCESPLKGLALKTHGFANVVALAGVAFTEEHARLLQRLRVERVAICFDTDSNQSGQKAALKSAELLFRQGIQTSIVTLPLPDGATKIDLDEYFLAHGADEFSALEPRSFLAVATDIVATENGVEAKYRAILPLLHAIGTRPEPTWESYAGTIAKTLPEFKASKLLKVISGNQKQDKRGKAEENRFQPSLVADEIYRNPPTIYYNGEFDRYAGGVYRYCFPEELDQITMNIVGPDVTAWHMNEVRRALQTKAFVRPETVNVPGLLNLSNCVLDTRTGDIKEHSVDFLSTIQLTVVYNPDAQCPRWHEFLDEVQPEPDNQNLLAEIFGYCLTADASKHKAFLFHGEGSNGKGVCCEVLEALCGRENVSALMLSDLNERFRLSELQNKLVNITPEVRAKDLIDDARWKSLVSGETQTGERKHQHPFKFKPFCKFIVCCNSLPVSRDKSYGYMRRLIILPFKVTIPDSKANPYLADEIIASELSGVLNWALAGLVRLREQGLFTIPAASRSALDEYREVNDRKIQFIRECIERDPASKTYLKILYEAYRGFCEENGFKIENSHALREALEREFGITKRDANRGVLLPGIRLIGASENERSRHERV